MLTFEETYVDHESCKSVACFLHFFLKLDAMIAFLKKMAKKELNSPDD